MKIRILGAGFYGCSIALGLIKDGHDVEVHEIGNSVFCGASGAIPARLHQGFHYPRSRMTRAACLEHSEEFLAKYGFLTRNVPLNIYAIAKDHSLVDFDQYIKTLEGEVEFIKIYDPREFGLKNVEGAVLTGERHIITDLARDYFRLSLGDRVKINTAPAESLDDEWDWTIDCTFCANDAAGVDRYEPCVVPLLKGPIHKAITIMDGPFHSLYPWNEELGLNSLSSARFTPLSKDCKTYEEAATALAALSTDDLVGIGREMLDAIAYFYPAAWENYEIVDYRKSIRAMPLSGADTRLVEVVKAGNRLIRIRAGKIDAVIAAERLVKDMIWS